MNTGAGFPMKESAFQAIMQEVNQFHPQRKHLLEKLKALRQGRAIVSLFISFYKEVPLSNEDADMIEEVLCNTDTSNGVTLLLDAPGGDGLAAERIIRVCKSYTKKDFETIVPARAKSAATMVCLGSDKILMSKTSELGPIDPQVSMKLSGEKPEWVAAHHVTKTYDDLLARAVGLTEGHIEPYLQQLSKFNAIHIEDLKTAQALSESIAISSLKRGMLNGKTDEQIKERIKRFIDPEQTMSHGRALNMEICNDCGLNIEEIPLESELWKIVWHIYLRSKHVVDRTNAVKSLDTVEENFTITI